MWPPMFNFGIAHWAMVNEFVDVLGRRICYRRMVIRVLQAGHNKVVFSSAGLFRKLAVQIRLLGKTFIG